MLADGRFSAMKSLFGFYHRIFDVSKARTKAWFNITGTFFPETKQQSGLYDSGGMGWDCKSAGGPTDPIPGNTYIRYHREGGLELSLMALDFLEHSGDLGYFQETLLPQIEAYVDYYAQHFKNGADGRLDMFPGQALETWQCKSVPPTRSTCVTNPMPQVAGLHALLPRLLKLNSTVVPDSGATAGLKGRWEALQQRVPDLPIGPCMQGAGKNTSTCLLPGAQLPPSTSNAENADLYAVHPFRVVGLYTNRSLGITTYLSLGNE
jgi:alpha-L-fucosidase 2